MRLGVSLCGVLLVSCVSRQPKNDVASGHTTDNKPQATATAPISLQRSEADRESVTSVSVHNVDFQSGPDFHVRVRWMRGTLRRTKGNAVPCLDDPNSFAVNIEAGVLSTSLKDLAVLLNSEVLKDCPLQHIALAAQGKRIKLNGTLHKGISLPVEVLGEVSAGPGNRVRIHVVKLRLLKMPVKGLLNVFHVKTEELFSGKGTRGITVQGDDIYLNCAELVPAPHPSGQLTDVHLAHGTDIIEVYGNGAKPEAVAVKQWRNFIRMRRGDIEFGKIKMHHADILMIDVSPENWFYFDLEHYQDQIVSGYARLTPQAGIQMFMSDMRRVTRAHGNQSVNLEWMKNRGISPPIELPRQN